MAVDLCNIKSLLLQQEAGKRDVATQTEDIRPLLYNLGRGSRWVTSAPDVVLGLPPRGRARQLMAVRAASEAFHRVMES